VQLLVSVLAVSTLSASIAGAAERDALEAAEQLEETIVIEHPPLLVYFRHATPSPSRIARQALRDFCRERAPMHAVSAASPKEGPANEYFCTGAKPKLLMGVNYRDEFNKTVYACRAEMDLHYTAYPLYWEDVFNDSHRCARIEYDYETRHYRVTQ
jgi:hypothetical protein